MRDLYEHYQRRIRGNTNIWRAAWREEIGRRRLEEEVYDIIPKRHRHLILSKQRRLEKELGPRWVCGQCKAEYRVKTPFNKLYCYWCLGRLRCRRLFPKRDEEPGNWVLDDDLRR